MNALGIPRSHKADFMYEIIGNEAIRELELIDSVTEDFNTKLFSLDDIWNTREQSSYPQRIGGNWRRLSSWHI